MNLILKTIVLAIALVLVSVYEPQPAVAKPLESRCGWWDNPTPGNIDFIDRDGDWTISQQGSYEARSQWSPSGQAETINGTYSRYCACIKVEADHDTKRILRIHSGRAEKLNTCYRDSSLPGYEPPSTDAVSIFIGRWVSENEDCIPGRDFLIQPHHISIGGDTVHQIKVVRQSPLWIELTDPGDPSDRFQRLSRMPRGRLEMQGSTTVADAPDGVQCVLAKKK